MKKMFLLSIIGIIFVIQMCSAAHYIVGYVENAKDGTSPNGLSIVLWNTEIGAIENVSDIIGPEGNSKASGIYMIDCEMLKSGCNVTNTLTLKVVNNGNNYISGEKSVLVGGYGYDIVENITLNSPPNITSIHIEDDLPFPEKEIDLIPAATKEIKCTAIATEYDGEFSLTNASAVFFDSVNSYFEDFNDNNLHYTNDSCEINYSYGTQNEAKITCAFYVWYYANSEFWNCTISVQDNFSIVSKKGDTSFINPLLALGVDSIIHFEIEEGKEITKESRINITNYGNIKINLSLSGYGSQEEDGYAMTCVSGEETNNIPVTYERFNLTKSNGGEISLEEFESKYINLTSSPKIETFNLDYRKSENQDEAVKGTYWRIRVPNYISGSCQGNIVFGAVNAPEN